MTFDGDVCVREIPLPAGVHGAIRESPDNVCNIYINQNDPMEVRRKTLEHEMAHFRLGHLGSGKTLRIMEDEADRMSCG